MSAKKNVSRRQFLKYAGLMTGAAATASIAARLDGTTTGQALQTPRRIGVPAVLGQAFKGVTVRMHAISGASYDELYKLIPKWEE